MAKYNKTVEAIQFVVSDEQKAEVKNKKQVFHSLGDQIRANGDEYFIVPVVAHESVKVEEGDYLIIENGSISSVVSQAEFEASYSAVEEAPAKKKTASEPKK